MFNNNVLFDVESPYVSWLTYYITFHRSVSFLTNVLYYIFFVFYKLHATTVYLTYNSILEIRKRLVRYYVLSIFLYASKSWTLNKQMENKINAFEMLIFRRMTRISHLDRKTNVEVLKMAKAKQIPLRTIQKRKLQYFGHLIWWKRKQKLLMEGKIEETRRRGK